MKTFLLTLLCALSFSIIAQKRATTQKPSKHYGISSKKHWHTLKIADQQVKVRSHYNAINGYQEVLEAYPDNEYVLYRLANAYYLGRDYKNAVTYYEQLISKYKKTQFGIAIFQYAESLKYLGEYENAQRIFSKFRRVKANTPEIKLAKKWSKNAKNYCQNAKVMAARDTAFFNEEVLPHTINYGYTDFSPMAKGEDTLYFASLRADSIQTYKHGEDHIFSVGIYESVRDREENTWSDPEQVTLLNEEYSHSANPVMGPDNHIFYTKCYQDPKNQIICGIHHREISTNGTLGKEKRLSAKINKHGYTNTQPTFGRGYKRKGRSKIWFDIMYFVSNRPGGAGGLDIWYSIYKDGKFLAPVNCGKSINTVRDEITPYYDQEKGKMFFSSNYKYGLGGQDIFVAKGKLKRFRKAENVGMPFNTSYDDTYFRPHPDTTKGINFGYFVSNRPGGFALASETCCDDIYRYESFIPDSIDLELLLTEFIPVPEEQLALNGHQQIVDTLGKETTSNTLSQEVIESHPTHSEGNTLQQTVVENNNTTSDNTSFNGSQVVKEEHPLPTANDNGNLKQNIDENNHSQTAALTATKAITKPKDLQGAKVGYMRKYIYNQEMAKDSTRKPASFDELVTWIDPTDKKGSTHMSFLEGKDYVLLIEKEGFSDTIIDIDETKAQNSFALQQQVKKKEATTPSPDNTPKVEFQTLAAAVTKNQKDAVVIKKEQKFVIEDLHFEYNMDIVKGESSKSLQLLHDFLKENPKVKVEISGHTDSKGHEDYNLDLSQRRAEAVMEKMISMGISPKRLNAKGYGETQPIASNELPNGEDNPKGRRLNRRTEIKILSSK